MIMQETPQRRGSGSRSWVLGIRVLLVVAVVAAAVFPFRTAVLEAMSGARLHSPRLALWAELTPAMQIHLIAALAAVVLGGALMVWRKGRRLHRAGGWIWAALMATVAVSSLFITGLNGGAWSLVHALTGLTIVMLPLGVLAARRHAVVRLR